MAIVLLLALASGAFADEYTPVDWLRVNSEGGFQVKLGFITMNIGGCIEWHNANINGTTYSTRASKWQYRKGNNAEWVDVPGSERSSSICAFDASYIDKMGGGQYRPVAEISIDGKVGEYTTSNFFIVRGESKEEEEESQETDESAVDESEDETGVEAVSWGQIKSSFTK